MPHCVTCRRKLPKGRSKYCNEACSLQAKLKRRRVARATAKKQVICPECETVFERCRAHVKYCSRACMYSANIKKKYEVHNPERYAQKPQTSPRKCLRCSKMFDSYGPQNRLCKTCSQVNQGLERSNRVDSGAWAV